MVRSYTGHLPMLRTFFISEFWGSLSSYLTCQKKSKKLSMENFPGKTVQGNFPGKTFQGREKAGEGRTESVRWRSRMRRGSLPRASTRSARGHCPPGTAGILQVPGVILGIYGVVTARRQGGSDEPARMMSSPGAPLVGLTRGVADWQSVQA
jgi:hypothetical protein